MAEARKTHGFGAFGPAGPRFESQLRRHLQADTHPPVPDPLVAVCRIAIARAAEGDHDSRIYLPRGIITQDGRGYQTVWEVVDVFGLSQLIDLYREICVAGSAG